MPLFTEGRYLSAWSHSMIRGVGIFVRVLPCLLWAFQSEFSIVISACHSRHIMRSILYDGLLVTLHSPPPPHIFSIEYVSKLSRRSVSPSTDHEFCIEFVSKLSPRSVSPSTDHEFCIEFVSKLSRQSVSPPTDHDVCIEFVNKLSRRSVSPSTDHKLN